MSVERLKNFINGEWVEAKTERLVEIRNPARDTILCRGDELCLSHRIRLRGSLSDRRGKVSSKGKFLSPARENQKFEKMVQQKSFGVIIDAIEANFSLELLDTDDYNLEAVLREKATLLEVRRRALEIEHTIIDFYLKAAEVSTGLMADIPRAFRKIAETRKERCLVLEALGKGL
jgi:hypothetical protein